MHRTSRSIPGVLALLALASATAPLGAQQRPGIIGDMLRDIEQVEQKLVGLAEAIPAEKYDWRPGEGVRSSGEVFLHVAADNFFLPTIGGFAAPDDTGILANDYPTVRAYEQRKLDKAATIAEMKRSFAHLKKALADTPDPRLDEQVEVFGMKATLRGFWLLATTHVHEHLGQMIAYARSNGIVPPWSR